MKLKLVLLLATLMLSGLGVASSAEPTSTQQSSAQQSPAQQPSTVETLLASAVTNARWRVAGTGEMSWFGFSVYGARLWVPNSRWDADKPYALELTYRRDITSERLVQTSIDEIERLGEKDVTRLKAWRGALAGVFPTVQKNDVIIGLYVPGEGARFFVNGKPSGRVSDTQLAAAFFSIWFDPRTRAPELRKRLLGNEP